MFRHRIKKEALETAANKPVKYVSCCPGSYFWIVIGALLLVSGVTSLLYLANLWSSTEVRYTGAFVLIVLGILVVTTGVRPRG